MKDKAPKNPRVLECACGVKVKVGKLVHDGKQPYKCGKCLKGKVDAQG